MPVRMSRCERSALRRSCARRMSSSARASLMSAQPMSGAVPATPACTHVSAAPCELNFHIYWTGVAPPPVDRVHPVDGPACRRSRRRRRRHSPSHRLCHRHTAISPPAIIFARNHLCPQSSLPAIISASNHLCPRNHLCPQSSAPAIISARNHLYPQLSPTAIISARAIIFQPAQSSLPAIICPQSSPPSPFLRLPSLPRRS